jgi:ATP-dependent Lhr-like helicase
MEFFRPRVRGWFESAHAAPTRVQLLGWPVLAERRNALLLAPTGSGKTLAAFLWAIDRVSRLEPDASGGVRILYISPLKALVYDVERNLRAPLAGIAARADDGLPFRTLRVDVRTGDTTSKERRQQLRSPADVLVTTPESLYLLLGGRASAHLKSVDTVIVDEIHALAGTKRGAHLSLSLERLSELVGRDPQRVGLSATVRAPDEVARFLAGDRPIEVVNASEPAHVDLSIRVPGPELAHEPGTLWARIYPEILDLLRAHRSTLIFVNSRSLAEKTAQRLNELARAQAQSPSEERWGWGPGAPKDAPLVSAHHGSLAHQKRKEIEEALKRGELQGIVATSSLELGIDMGAIDLVVLVESPGSVARGLQRVGRSGHSVGERSRGILFPKFRGDLLECAVVAERMLAGEIEALRVPGSPLDVLAQQVVAICAEGPRRLDEIHALARRAFPYRELTREVLVSVVEMLSGQYSAADLADLRPRLAWDRARDVLSPRAGAKMLSLLNAGTIPDRGLYAVHLGEGGPRIGELDEEMVYEARRGETFYLGASTWRIEAITRDRVVVSPAPGEPGKTPFWRGDGPGRPLELGRALGRFTREIATLSRAEAISRLVDRSRLDTDSATHLLGYLDEQREQGGSIPTDENLVIERFRDELGDWRIAILSPFGARVHGPWALAVQNALAARSGFEVETTYSDDGIMLRFPDADALPGADLLIPAAEEVEDRVVEELSGSALFASTFRESAARALLLPRRSPDRRAPLWQQRLRAKNLLAAVSRYPSFPIVLESYRHCLQDVFDLPALREILSGIARGEIQVSEVSTPSPSPFARSLTFAYVASYLYEQDAPAAERRAHALSLDRGLLREILGETDLRQVLDPDAVAEVEAELEGLAPGWQARNADELEDLLRRVGALSLSEIRERSTDDPVPWIAKLLDEDRAARITVAGEERFAAAADLPHYRELEGLEELLLRYARRRGPFRTEEAADRFGVSLARVEPILKRLESEGRLTRAEREWYDVEVLRRLKRRTMEKLRKEAAPVEPAALGRFFPAWQGLVDRGRGIARLEETLVRLEGLPLPWSSLVEHILPGRVEDFRIEMLDMVSASGAFVWVGRGALGPRDGRVAFYRRERAALLLGMPPPYVPRSELEARILETLARRGASFEVELAPREGALSISPLRETLLPLMWEGRITNDTFFPLRRLGKTEKRTGRSRPRPAPPKFAGGRWSLVEGLLDPTISETERAHARVTMLLDRYGLVSRAVAQFEEIPAGYASIYPVLREMEERGRLRRGHFVEGLPGSQFALPGAVERLRAHRGHSDRTDEEIRTLLAVDPANPYGSVLPWPESHRGGNPRRVPGAWVLLHRGALALFLEKGGRTLLTFSPLSDPDVARAVLGALRHLPRRRPQRLRIASIDDQPPAASPYFELLSELGFFREASSMVYAEYPRGGLSSS